MSHLIKASPRARRYFFVRHLIKTMNAERFVDTRKDLAHRAGLYLIRNPDGRRTEWWVKAGKADKTIANRLGDSTTGGLATAYPLGYVV